MDPDSQADAAHDLPPAVLALLEEFSIAITGGQLTEAEGISKALAVARQLDLHDETNPYFLLDMEATEAESAGDWRVAEVAYRRQLERATAENHSVMKVTAWRRLSQLDDLLGKPQSALENARNALQESHGLEDGWLRAVSLESVAVAELKLGNASASHIAIDAALAAIMETLVEVSEPEQFDLFRARLAVIKAAALVAAGNPQHGLEELRGAWEPISVACSSGSVSGGHNACASWWEVKARIAMAAHDALAVHEAWSNAITSWRLLVALPYCIGPQWPASLASALAEYATVARALGDLSLANELETESRKIRAKIRVTAA